MVKQKEAVQRSEVPPLTFGGRWQYAPAPESTDHVAIEPRQGLFINGEFVRHRGEWLQVVDPATEQVLAEVPQASLREVSAAVGAARKAYMPWGALPGEVRARYLFRIARLIQERARELACLETMNGGKPIRESRDVDVPLAAAHFFHHAGWADKLELCFPGERPGPIGVIGQVIPWNFPLLMAAWKIAPAL